MIAYMMGFGAEAIILALLAIGLVGVKNAPQIIEAVNRGRVAVLRAKRGDPEVIYSKPANPEVEEPKMPSPPKRLG